MEREESRQGGVIYPVGPPNSHHNCAPHVRECPNEIRDYSRTPVAHLSPREDVPQKRRAHVYEQYQQANNSDTNVTISTEVYPPTDVEEKQEKQQARAVCVRVPETPPEVALSRDTQYNTECHRRIPVVSNSQDETSGDLNTHRYT